MEKVKIRRPISQIRQIFQVLSFCFIVFGGLLGLKRETLDFLPFVEKSKIYDEYKEQLREEGRPLIIVGPDYPQAFNLFLPIKSCRFLRETGTFRACFLHFISESIGWRASLRAVLPHIVGFLVMGLLLGRAWCGWVCPLGFIQDILNKARKVLKAKPFFLSDRIERVSSHIRWELLIVILILSVVSAIPSFSWTLRKQIYLSVCQMCPSRYIFPYIGGWPIVHTLTPLGYGVFTIISAAFTMVLLGSFFIRRSWCRVCPSGLLLSFFNRGAFLTKEKEGTKCTRCGICLNVCPLQSEDVYLEKRRRGVDSPRCIHCFRCVDSCPQNECLRVRFFGKVLFRSRFKP